MDEYQLIYAGDNSLSLSRERIPAITLRDYHYIARHGHMILNSAVRILVLYEYHSNITFPPPGSYRLDSLTNNCRKIRVLWLIGIIKKTSGVSFCDRELGPWAIMRILRRTGWVGYLLEIPFPRFISPSS